jgi:hypothetical protein
MLEVRRDITGDVEMPRSMDGLRLAQAVGGRWSPIKVVATSGRYVVRDGDLPSGGLFLRKPTALRRFPPPYGTSPPSLSLRRRHRASGKDREKNSQTS